MSPGVEVARKGLDTILHVDSLVSLTLRPAGSALLMIFPVGPDTTISTGDLAYNNSRKVVFDGVQYHCVYMRKNDTLGPSEVFYRRSVPVSNENNAILWEPVEYSVSRSNGTDNQNTRTHNRTPSITFRTIDGNTYLTVTWSCEPFPAMSSTVREICQRTFRADDFGPQFGPIQTISLYQGSENSEYGTPVVSRLDGRGYVVAWSDSLDGIVARLARLQALDPSLLNDTLLLSSRHLVSANLPQAAAGPLRCLYPTMPPFSHIAALDSNVGIAFEARILGQQNIDIVYKRLWWQADTLLSNNYTKLNSFAGQHRHPSMDLWQDFNNHAYEGVVWEEIIHDAVKNNDYTYIWFQPLATRAERYDTNAPNNFSIHWDNPDSTTTWQWTKVLWVGTQREKQAPGYGWPSTAALNEVTDYVNQFDTGHFAIVWVDTTAYDGTSETEDSTSVHTMRSTKVYFGNAELVPGYPHDYMFDGYQPTHVASTVRQDLQSGVLYNTGRLNDSASVMRTSRQFFGKVRPTGYVAQGRSLVIRLNDSTATGLRVEMSNAWYADDTVAQGLRLSPRGPSSQSIDSMAQVRSLFRTDGFTTHDSVTVGVDIKADFAGDSTLAGGAEMTCTIQLVDSATDDVVEVLGSFTISAADTAYSASLESDLDLLSGSYYLRMAIDTSGITPVPSSVGSLYPVDEMYRCVGDHEFMGKVRRLQGSGGGAARLDIHPNPSIGVVEVRFSIPTASRVTVHVVDQRGDDVLIPVQTTMMESGRYAVALDGSRLAPGVYLVELRAGKERVVEKMVITR